MKNIIIAGSGLGGLVAGARLAKQGYSVNMYSACTAETHGYDWGDCMSIALLEKITGKDVPQSDYGYIADTRHHSPSDKADMAIKYTSENRPQFIERAVLSRYLIEYALESGVNIHWSTNVNGALLDKSRVIGISTSDGDKFADMVIDACGIFSAVRESLPDCCLVEQKCAPGEAFYAYRGLYEKLDIGDMPEYPYNVHLLHQYEKGISWCVTEEGWMDILIGRFEPIPEYKIESVLRDFIPKYPELTDKLIRGGQMTNIPVRRPLAKPVCDGYAAVGDSAYMTIPMIGSGIDLALNAGELLAETIIKDRAGKYSTRTLWSYQYNYITRFGADLVPIDSLKNVLLSMKPHDVDYFLDNRVITEDDLMGGGSMPISAIIKKAIKGAPRIGALLEVAKAVAKGEKATAAYKSIPENYTEAAYLSWKSEIDACR